MLLLSPCRSLFLRYSLLAVVLLLAIFVWCFLSTSLGFPCWSVIDLQAVVPSIVCCLNHLLFKESCCKCAPSHWEASRRKPCYSSSSHMGIPGSALDGSAISKIRAPKRKKLRRITAERPKSADRDAFLCQEKPVCVQGTIKMRRCLQAVSSEMFNNRSC